MIVKEEFLSKIRTYFGLNLYEAKIWTALLSRGIATAGELSDIANVPRSRSYDILESLEKKGFVTMKFGKPIKYIAVQPSEVVERVKKHMVSETKTRIDRLDKIRDTEILDELQHLHTQGIELVEPSELSGSIRGRHNLYNHLELMIRTAEKSVTIVTTTQGLIRKVEGFLPIFEDLKKRGVKVRIAAPLTKECEPTIKALDGFAEVRNTDLKARFISVDGKEIAFMIMDDQDVHPTYDVGIWVNSPFFAAAMQDLFNHAWKSMKPITVPSGKKAAKKK
ncbi:MAG: TrmB family transcriptional regulator [Candidatus Woesearchaeota archaeon]